MRRTLSILVVTVAPIVTSFGFKKATVFSRQSKSAIRILSMTKVSAECVTQKRYFPDNSPTSPRWLRRAPLQYQKVYYVLCDPSNLSFVMHRRRSEKKRTG